MVIRKKNIFKIFIYFSIFLFPFLKSFVITNRDNENVISVIDIIKIILYFSPKVEF